MRRAVVKLLRSLSIWQRRVLCEREDWVHSTEEGGQDWDKRCVCVCVWGGGGGGIGLSLREKFKEDSSSIKVVTHLLS